MIPLLAFPSDRTIGMAHLRIRYRSRWRCRGKLRSCRDVPTTFGQVGCGHGAVARRELRM